jgi:hypothetical protein
VIRTDRVSASRARHTGPLAPPLALIGVDRPPALPRSVGLFRNGKITLWSIFALLLGTCVIQMRALVFRQVHIHDIVHGDIYSSVWFLLPSKIAIYRSPKVFTTFGTIVRKWS